MTELHAAAWPAVAVGLAVVAAAGVVSALLGRFPRMLDWLRLAALTALVAEASIGLALAVRGARPVEPLHWIYGAVVIAVVLAPSALSSDLTPGRRSWAVAAGSAIGAILVWRLWASA